MRRLDLESWARREHFELFSGFDWPHFGFCANVDVTPFHAFVEQNALSFNVATIFVIAKAANAIPEFRYRIRSGQVIEHDVVHPSSTIMGDDGVFGFCTLEYVDDFSVFVERATVKIADARARPRLLEEDGGRDDLLFMTAIPWVSFTSFMHPLHLHPVDSIPRFAWGKYFHDGDGLTMPLGVQAHHAVMDGLHAARLYAEVQESFRQPASALAGTAAGQSARSSGNGAFVPPVPDASHAASRRIEPTRTTV